VADINPRADLALIQYVPAPPPFSGDPRDERIRFLVEQLDKLKNVIAELADAAPQVANTAPLKPRYGMIRFVRTPWDPLSDGSLPKPVFYDGTAWTAL